MGKVPNVTVSPWQTPKILGIVLIRKPAEMHQPHGNALFRVYDINGHHHHPIYSPIVHQLTLAYHYQNAKILTQVADSHLHPLELDSSV